MSKNKVTFGLKTYTLHLWKKGTPAWELLLKYLEQ